MAENNALWRPTHSNADERIQELEEWVRDVVGVLERGADLMPLEKLGEWRGVRGVLETAPIELQEK